MKFYLTISFLFVALFSVAQFSDDFEDGDFTTDPTWTGSSSNFEVNGFNQLHLIAPAVADTSYLSVFSSAMDDVIWDFWLNMDFNPSSGNNTRIYLVSDQVDLKGPLNGYFVMVGNSSDEISLYKQTGTTITEILDGTDNSVDLSSPEVRVRVTRDLVGNWEVLRDTIGGYTFVSEGTVFDDTHTTTSYFGVFCKYTSSRSDLFYFDNLGSPYIDGVPPTIVEITVVSSTQLDVLFSEPIDPVTGTFLGNYSIDGGIGNPSSAVIDGGNPALVHLTFDTPFTNGENYQISVENVEDLEGNSIVAPTVLSFLYFVPVAAVDNDVIITEILADPNPIIDLPEVEFFEIYNRSDKIFDLANWSINDNTTTADFESYILGPSEYVIICGPDEGVLFGISNFLEVDGLPTLTNSDDDLVLKDNTGLEIDSIHYFQSWYHNSEKENGGWTIEIKHLDSPCSDANNWGASVNSTGGTPGIINSIWTDEDDISPPVISELVVNSNELVELYFNEAMDTLIPLNYSLSPGIVSLDGEYTALDIYFLNTLVLLENTIYNLTVTNGQDCWGNEINQTVAFGLPGEVLPENIILNEIMFNPLSGGSDYVELFNNSNKIIDLNDLYFASWDDSITHFQQVSSNQFLLLPGQYATLTEDSTDIINDFSIYGIGRFVDTDLPTYPNDSGTVYLFRSDSVLIDYFHYDEDFHFSLLSSNDGKALERITFGGGMNNPDNWHTASENVDWGTPGYLNSQFIIPSSQSEVSIEPQLFSPDNDGYKDVLTISFDFENADNVLDVSIYDNQGRLIRLLKDNYFIGQHGFVTWDGINDEGTKAAIGTYIVLVSVKDKNGNENVFKRVVVLGGNL